VLGLVRHRWWITGTSALLGAASHVAWDHVTHASIAGTGFGLPVLGRIAVAGVPWWMLLHLASSVIGAVVWLALTVHIGRRRLLLCWHGPAPRVRADPRRFWGTVAVTLVVGCALALLVSGGERQTLLPFVPSLPRPVVVAARLLCVAALALVVSAATHPGAHLGRSTPLPAPEISGNSRPS